MFKIHSLVLNICYIKKVTGKSNDITMQRYLQPYQRVSGSKPEFMGSSVRINIQARVEHRKKTKTEVQG